MAKLISGEKIYKLLRFALMTEDGYIAFTQGPSYSSKSKSVFYDTTVASNALIVVGTSQIEKMELINTIPMHPSIGKFWREGNKKLTILSVYENGLVEVAESYCSYDLNEGCSASAYTHSLRKPGPIFK